MTLPEYCHLISQIEIDYYSTSKLPRWLIYTFKHPRSDSNLHKSTHGTNGKPDTDTYSICNSILHSYGYSLEDIINVGKLKLEYEKNADNETSSASKGEVVKYNSRIKRKASSIDSLESENDTKLHVERLVQKSMVYYFSLFDDYSHKHGPIIRNGEIKTNKAEWISKNSSYEMICSLKDCLSQFSNSGNSQNEAVCITKEYSGIFSSNDVLITRSNVSFREMLKNEGITYSTIYDEVISRSKNAHNLLPSDIHVDDSEVVRLYLANDLPKNLGSSHSDTKVLMQGKIGNEELAISRSYVLRSLKLGELDEYDLSTIRIQGRSNCHKLFKCLEKDCANILLNLKKRDVTNPMVKCVISNFPVLFSKVHDLRFNLEPSDETSDRVTYKIGIGGLILPSVLANIFRVIKILNNRSIINKPRINVKYNSSLDDELYEKSLRISDKNRIYQNFMRNFTQIKKEYPYSYKTLKKFIPFSHFVVHGGEVIISNKHLILKGITDLKSEKLHSSLYGGILSIKDETKELDAEVFSQPLDNAGQIIFLKDTLYLNLSIIKHAMKHIDGASNLAKSSTKSFLDESLCNISYTMVNEICEANLSLIRCYLELYPDIDSSTVSIMTKVTPFNLTNLIWVICYLMHCYGKVPFFDRKYYEQRNIVDEKIILDNLKSRVTSKESNFGCSFHIDNDILSFTKSLEYPLAQQSYVIHLVNHINFNKGFFHKFGLSYSDYYTNKQTQYDGSVSLASIPALNSSEYLNGDTLQHVNTSSSPDGIAEMLELDNLTSGWKTFLGKVKAKNPGDNENASQLSEESTKITNVSDKDDNFPKIDTMDLNEINTDDFKSYDIDALMQSAKVDSSNKDMAPLYYNTDVENVNRIRAGFKLVNNSVNVKFGVVSSESRPHGRMHKCLFDFDSNTTFNDIHKNPNYNIINQFNDVISQSHEVELKQKVHIVFMFLCTSPISITESNYIKLIKNVINSNLMVLTCDPKNIVYDNANIDENTNIQSYIDKFKKGQFANVAKVFKKNGISYSFIISGDNVREQMSDLVKHVGVYTDIKFYSIPILSDSLYLLNESCKENIEILNEIRIKYSKINISYEIVRISWIFDSYFDGILICDSNVPKRHKLVFHNSELVDAYPVEELIDEHYVNIPACVERPVLGFNNDYKNVTFLWGFEIYLLYDQENIFVTPRDCMFYRKYCGINLRLLNSLEIIEREIQETIQNKLYSLNITDSDVSKFFSHGKIYTNSLVLSANGDRKRVKRRSTSAGDTLDACICPCIGNICVCFGGFDGIPILDFRWLYSTLNSSKPAPMRDYLVC
ncbi:hypothetical protein BEWA_012470 [Theileria equi strain WA]|uniref:BRCT domain-containing protein n=1 Tax=Theileria equi strain WA TaxID=1537102 RepID=L1LBY3_THEEQ|nr:hypothetical protein BEWA_012470 [Theileria equi strain WA]EKX72688.1 hypothetical protein BEWA_012470 [Theileria equi strain WA]|eukprot:XP_004832140.1 hypothetical protein BEWA_012470 [Theileria equi strain WA]